MAETIKLWKHQEKALDFLINRDARFTGGGLFLGVGTGKRVALDTRVPTPCGWTTFGELYEGQYIFGDDGVPTRIEALHPIELHPDLYRVAFSDGSYIDADAEHLWGVYEFPMGLREERAYAVRDTAYIRDNLMSRASHRFAVATTRPVEYPEKDLPLDPYVLGVWLGDGSANAGVITQHPNDFEVIQYIVEAGFDYRQSPTEANYWGIYGLQTALKSIGVFGNKHIPDAYLQGSVRQRLALVQGLMDTDGSCDTRGRCEFSQSNNLVLITQVHELVQSLGIKATVRASKSTLYGRNMGTRYRISFTTNLPVFRLERKAKRLPIQVRPTQNMRYVVSVSPIDPRPARCITVDNQSGLFLVGDAFIPTHNTRTAMRFIQERGYRTVLVLCPKAAGYVWQNEVEKLGLNWKVVDLTDGAVRGRVKELAATYPPPAGAPVTLWVLNYDAMMIEPMKSALRRSKFDLLIADEAHRLKSPKGKQSNFVGRYIKNNFKYRLAMTGTPFHNGPLDVFGILRVMAGTDEFKNWNGFRYHYGIWGGYQNYQLVGLKNQDELAATVDRYAYTIKSSDVLDLPSFRHIHLPVELEPFVMDYYKQFEREYVVEVEQGTMTAGNAMVSMLRLSQLTGGFMKMDDGTTAQVSKAKSEVLADWLENIDKNEPLVIFYRFNAELGTIREVLHNLNRSYSMVNGLTKELKNWQKGETSTVVIQIQSGNAGIDLTRAAICVYYSLDWSLGNYEQSLGRIHRPGQERPVTYYHLVANGTVDADLHDALEDKSEAVGFVTERLKERYYGNV